VAVIKEFACREHGPFYADIEDPFCPTCRDEEALKAARSEHSTTAQADPVNNPSHYTQGGIECIDAIKAQLTKEEYRGFLKGTIAAYLWRERYKGGSESVAKARWYINKLMEEQNEK